MDREFLTGQLAAGRSLAEIARAVGKHPSTVSYWLRKHGLRAARAERFAARGGIPYEALAALVEEGLPIAAIAARLDRSPTTVRHWLARHGPRTEKARWRDDRALKPREVIRHRRRHGRTRFVAAGGAGHYRCAACRAARVARRRRRIKEILVSEAGGRCEICGYDRTSAALQFHHLDRDTKEFGLGHSGVSRSLDRARQEAAKCILLCANCHAEVEAAIVNLPLAVRDVEAA